MNPHIGSATRILLTLLPMLLAASAFAQSPMPAPDGDSPRNPPAPAPDARPADAAPRAAAPAPEARPTRMAPTPPTAAAKPAEPARAASPAPPRATDAQPPKAATRPTKKRKKRSKAFKKIMRFLTWFHPSTVWYLQYRYGETRPNDGSDSVRTNKFFVGRGYMTLKFKPTKWFEARITMDSHQDDEGDWKVRLKYLYAKFKWPLETAFITEPFVEFGIAHIPWLDYEEHINYYRAQGTMFIERNKVHNSADLGFTIGTLFGRKLSKSYQKKVNKKYPGTWGSAAFGVYNGAGYHAKELNNWKNIEGRVSVRPLGHIFPNLQVSYFFIWGKGATRPDPVNPGDSEFDWPAWQENIFLLSFEHQYLVATAQYVFGKGTQQGDRSGWLNTDGTARSYKGASGFLEVKLPWIKSSLWGRYDYWDGPYEDVTVPYHRFIGAYVFHFWGQHKNFLMLDFEYLKFDDGAIANAREDRWQLTLSVQVKLK